MDPLGDQLTTHPFQTGWEFTIKPYLGWRFRWIDNPDSQFVNGSIPTRARTQSDGPEPLLTLVSSTPWDLQRQSEIDKAAVPIHSHYQANPLQRTGKGRINLLPRTKKSLKVERKQLLRIEKQKYGID